LLFFLLLCWFATHFLFNNLVGRADRTDIVLWSLAECAFVFLIVIAVFLKNFLRESAFAVRNPGDKWILGILAAWGVLTVAALWAGWRDGNDTTYLLGDFYRFGSLAVMVAAFYFSNLDSTGVRRLVRGFVLVYGAFLIFDAIQYGRFINEGIRPATQTAATAGTVAPLVIYVSLFDPKRVFRIAARLVLLAMFAALIAAQMFTPILSMLFCLGLFLVPTKRASVAMGLAIGTGVLFVSIYYADALMNTDLTYLQTKIRLASGAYSPQEVVESLSGVRLGEIRFVLDTLRNSPADIPLGTGLGGMVSARTVSWFLPSWLAYKHYLHSGLNEILYRTGGVGLGLFLSLVSLIFRRGYRLFKQGQTFGLLVVVGIANLVLLMSFATDLTTGLPLLVICFTGLSLAEGEAFPRQAEARRKKVSAQPRFELGIEGTTV
jgi:hypothetical protein